MPRRAAALIEAVDAPATSDCRSRILDATATVVSRSGYGATTVTEILATADVSAAEFGRHFSDREDCFLAAYDEAVARIEDRVRAALAGWRDGWARGLRRAVGTVAELLDSDPRLARVCGREILFAGPRALDRHRATIARLVPVLSAGRGLHSNPEAIPPDLERTLLGGAILSLGSASRPTDLVAEVSYFLLVTYMEPATAWALAEPS